MEATDGDFHLMEFPAVSHGEVILINIYNNVELLTKAPVHLPSVVSFLSKAVKNKK